MKKTFKKVLVIVMVVIWCITTVQILVAQPNGNFKSIRLVNVADSSTVQPINSTIYYNEQTKALKAYVNNVWYTLVDSSGHSSPILGTNEYYGSIYSASSWSTTNGFTVNGGTVTVTSNKLDFSGGSNDFTKSLDYNYYTCLDKITLEADIKITNGAAIFGLGTNSVVSAQSIDFGGGMNASGTVYLASGTALLSQRVTSATNLVFSVNDIIHIIVEKDQYTIRVRVNNVTQPTQPIISLEQSFVYTPIPADLLPLNTGKPCIWNSGGTFTVNSFSIRSNDFKNANLFIGDSKTARRSVETGGKGYNDFLSANYYNVTSNAGNSEITDNVLLRIPEITALNPARIFLNIGRNDLAAGTPLDTITAHLTSIFNQLTTNGFTVNFLLGFYETTVNQSALNAWIVSTYPNNYIDTSGPISLTDGVHPDRLGHLQIYNWIKNAGKMINPRLNSWGYKDGVNFYDNFGLPSQSPNLLFKDAYDQSNNILQVGAGTAGNVNIIGNYPPGTSYYNYGQLEGVNQMGFVQDALGTYGGTRNWYIRDFAGASNVFGISTNGNISIGSGTPTAALHLKAGTATASTAPLKFTSGTNLTSPEAGAVEYSSNVFYFSPGASPVRAAQISLTAISHTDGTDVGALSYNTLTWSNDASILGGTNKQITLQPLGTGDLNIKGSGTAGSYIILSNLPTSCAGAPTGALANVAGVLTICP